MRLRILPLLATLWGLAIVLRFMIVGPDGAGAYAFGQVVGGVFGVLLIIVGVQALTKARA